MIITKEKLLRVRLLKVKEVMVGSEGNRGIQPRKVWKIESGSERDSSKLAPLLKIGKAEGDETCYILNSLFVKFLGSQRASFDDPYFLIS